LFFLEFKGGIVKREFNLKKINRVYKKKKYFFKKKKFF